MYLLECEATFGAEPDTVWKLWTDVARWLFVPRMRRDIAESLAALERRLSE
jgi:hypothetical protein